MERPTRCAFDHPGIAALRNPVFRLTEGDRVPALAIKLDGSEAVVPIKSVSKLFAIVPGSPDAKMLQLVGESLRFVGAMRLGDPLPAEVLTGEASWTPTEYHREVASARLKLQLVRQICGPLEADPITPAMLVASIDDPSFRPRVQDSLQQAAESLGLQGGRAAVVSLIEELAVELSYFEALRERLLDRIQALGHRLATLAQEGGSMAKARRETLMQVVRLRVIGQGQVASRFDQVEQQTKEVSAVLGDTQQQRVLLRPVRDWLYCTQMAWEPLLTEWEALAPGPPTERLWRALDALYRFLAPRYMAVHEWQTMMAAQGTAAETAKAYVW